ncbi:MAG TPA: hypothetical protein VGH45_00335 [Solirubrobacteraceae bacterium]
MVTLKPVLRALVWIDRFTTEVGENCCAVRAQTALRDTVSAEPDPEPSSPSAAR